MDINSAKLVIEASDKADDTVIMEGLHGIGKSNIVKQHAKEKNKHLIELFLSHQEVGDLIGIPHTIIQEGESLTTWTKPIWLQRMIDAAWPIQFEYGTLSFNDKDLKAYVVGQLNDPAKSDIITRESLNAAYATYHRLGAGLHLVNGQMELICSDSRHSVLFLDELNRAPIDVRQSALQLVLEKQIHEHSLPMVQGKPSLVVAAINPADQYQVDELDPALLDRFLHIEVEADAKAWLKWARSSNVNRVVCDFIAEHADKLHFQPQDGTTGATPRSWAKLGDFVNIIEEIPHEIQFQIFKGKIGSALAGQFLSYYNNYTNVVKVEDIEKLVRKEAKKDKNPLVIAKAITKLIEKQEAIQKTELAEQFITKYVEGTPAKGLPMIAFLHAIEIELLNSILKQYKDDKSEEYMKLAAIDDKLTGKELFKKIILKVDNAK